MIQEIIENGQIRSLKKFADYAMEYLADHPSCHEVVQLADHITELEKDSMTRPDILYPLPEGYEYNFSGHFGQVIGVGRSGIRKLPPLYRRDRRQITKLIHDGEYDNPWLEQAAEHEANAREGVYSPPPPGYPDGPYD